MQETQQRQAFILLTNKATDAVRLQYKDIQTAAKEFDDTFLLYHDTSGKIPVELENTRYLVFTDDILNNSNYIPAFDTLIPGSNHFPLLDFYCNHPDYDHYWYIEDDVRFNGDWKVLFNFFSSVQRQPDFITSHIRTYQEEPAWHWWETLSHAYNYIPHQLRLRSFNPIFRISNAALNFIVNAQKDRWSGHHEVLLPTLLYLEGFEISDFGGVGDFVKPGCENKFYIGGKTDIHGNLNSGTMRYRPVIQKGETETNKLYHPVKL